MPQDFTVTLTDDEAAQLRELGVADLDLVRMLRTFNAAAPAFRAESEELTS